MSVLKYFTAIWISVVVYSVLFAFFGSSSFSSYDAIFSERDKLAENMEDLKVINQELGGTLSALRYDSDTIAVYARELGYGSPNEHFIRISGLPSAAKRRLSAGRQIIPDSPSSVSDKTIHIIAISAGLITLIFLIVLEMGKKQSS